MDPAHHCALPIGARITVRGEYQATVTDFVPQDGFQLGCRVDGFPFEGRIVRQAECAIIDIPRQEFIHA